MVPKRTREAGTANQRRKKTTGKKEPRQTILLACEGHTEAAYFQDLGQHHRVAVTALALGRCSQSLVNEAVRISKAEGVYSEVWVVFDKDDEEGGFNSAIRIARDKNIGVAYSNESFELWFCLHYDYIDAGLSRDQYCDKMALNLGARYCKPHPDIYWTLLPRQEQAIRFAERLMANYPEPNPYRDNPSTTVHELVKRLKVTV